MKKERYINASTETLTIPGVGEIEPGEVVELPAGFHNANFKRVPIRGVEPRKHPEEVKKSKTRRKKNTE